MKITVLGAGAWGTSLALVLHQNGHQITLWGHNAERLQQMQSSNKNEAYLAGVALPAEWTYHTDILSATNSAEVIIAAVPSKSFRGIADNLADYSGIIVSATKGIEYESCLTMCGVLSQATPKAATAALSGPSFAAEVARGMPTAVVIACESAENATIVQKLFHRPTFRAYTSLDTKGVELGGALKNVIAVAAGVCDGLGFGDSSKAALITRAMAEVRRLGASCGANPDTFAGLSGLGDLTVTCFSRHSRNRGFGEKLGKGAELQQLLESSKSVVEGYHTARSAYQLARRHNVITPVVDEVYAMLYEGKNLSKGVRDLLSRDSKAED